MAKVVNGVVYPNQMGLTDAQIEKLAKQLEKIAEKKAKLKEGENQDEE